MDIIYNEVFGLYYYMMKKILEKSVNSDVSLAEINNIVSLHGFSESNIYFTPDAISQGYQGYKLLRKTDSGYRSMLKSAPVEYLTTMQQCFIKSILSDHRVRLFFDEHMLDELDEKLHDVEPLYNIEDIVFKETALDSDNYSDEEYIANFKTILYSIKNNRAMKICFNNSKGERKTVRFAPYKLEYGIRDDKFRLCGLSIINEIPKGYVKINLARIQSIAVLEHSFDFDFEPFIAAKRKNSPIEIEVYNLRNGFERVFISLSNYERVSSFNEESGKCNIKIYYTDDDEQELLIQLLSYGPAIKVLGPEEFKQKLVERISRQHSMLNKP